MEERKTKIGIIVIFFIFVVLQSVSAELNYTTGEAIYTNYSWNWTHTNDNFTISAWVKLKSSGTMPVIYKPFSYALLINSDNKTEFRLNNRTNFSSSGTVSLNTWTFIAATYNGTNINLYINTSKTDHSYSEGYYESSDTVEVIIGKDASDYFNGTIDEVRFFDKSLNDNEIDLSYYSNLRKYEFNKWLFYTVQKGLTIGLEYFYSFFIIDFSSLSNSTEQRTIKGNSKPVFVSVTYTPTSDDDIDPNENQNSHC